MSDPTTPSTTALEALIRDVPDFPEKGILFKDITPLLGDPDGFQSAINLLSALAEENGVTKIVGIDARGFIFAAAVALKVGAGFVPVRKKGKLPWTTKERAYSLEYGQNVIELHQDAVKPGEKVLLIDDLLATGGTAAAALELLLELEADVVAASFLIELKDLNGREEIAKSAPGIPVHAVLRY